MAIEWKNTPIKEILYHAAVARRPVLLRYPAADGKMRELVLTSVRVDSRVEISQQFDTFDLSTITEIRVISKQGNESCLKDYEELRLLVVDEPWMECCEANLM